ncbi:MAG TPA: hypothetical protein VIZ67_12215 [Acidimicrobiales bacterium]|jgi:hypothetical protein
MSPPVPPPPDLALTAHVETADAAMAGRGARAPTSALLRVSAPDAHPSGELACYPIDPIHPLDLLLGFVAPVHWWALGVSGSGLQHPIGDDGRVFRRADSPRVRVTVLIDRSGRGAGLLRRGTELTAMPGPPGGAVADACRRALGLGTAPPPRTTVMLWTLCWLDRVVDALAESGGAGGGGAGGLTWRDLARLHPASSVTITQWSGLGLGPDADALADATRALADAWPWARLRADPAAVDVPGPLPDARVIAWMDDGMWARWLLAAFPALDDLVDAACSLLAPNLARAARQVVHASVGEEVSAAVPEEPT